MDPISQGALGAVVPQSVLGNEKLRIAAIIGCIAGLAPDLDVFIQSASDPLLALEYHRQFTHALLFIPIGAAIVTIAVHGFVRRKFFLWETYLVCLLGYATHGLLDACTAYGTQLLWPFSNYRVAWNNVSVVDPFFTLPLVCLVVFAGVLRRRALALVGLAWAVGYLIFGVVQHQRAETTGELLAATRGHEPTRLVAKSGLGNLLVWRVVYEHKGHYYVDAVRTGMTSTVCPGSSIASLDLSHDFQWLQSDTQQRRDVERFRWFSGDYLAVDPRMPNRIVDIGYSVVPNAIDPLWGIELDSNAPREQHVRYVEEEAVESRPEEDNRYWRLLIGMGCHAIAN